MKVKTTTFREQHQALLKEALESGKFGVTAEITTGDMVADSILCYSTEKLIEDDFNPWAPMI